jgi:hypothetical protein
MEDYVKRFTKSGMLLPQKPDSGLELFPNKKYRLTRQMYLFQKMAEGQEERV